MTFDIEAYKAKLAKRDNTVIAYYIIVDGGDGSAGVQFFESAEAAALEIERMEKSPHGEYALSDYSYCTLNQYELDEATTLEQVRAAFAAQNEGRDYDPDDEDEDDEE